MTMPVVITKMYFFYYSSIVSPRFLLYPSTRHNDNLVVGNPIDIVIFIATVNLLLLLLNNRNSCGGLVRWFNRKTIQSCVDGGR